ncbi:MAG: HPP family protein [Methanohalobium sp.]|uniref:CBS domain-containing protein n=1 Tax=Methanohalobium sp. TaxID=2837493 RepID=UPI00397B46AC
MVKINKIKGKIFPELNNSSGSDGDRQTMSDKCQNIGIKDIIKKDVVTISEDDLIVDIINMFTSHRFHSYPVLNAKGKLTGVINQNTILKIMLFHIVPQTGHTNLALKSLSNDAKGIMDPHPIKVSLDSNLCDVAKMMVKHNVNQVFAVDNDRLIGIVSKLDVINEIYKIRG